MSNIAIVAPIELAAANIAAGGGAGGAYLATPDPKEAWVSGALAGTDPATISIDLGQPRTIDCVFVGYTDLPPTSSIRLLYGNAVPAATLAGQVNVVPARFGSQHAFLLLAAPISARYLQIEVRHGAGAARSITVGVLTVGASFRPDKNYEYGSGRTIGDTGTATRLFGGGFGFEDGVSFGGWTCSLADLSDDEREQIYAILRSQRTTRSLLVAEDPDLTPGLNERLHWSVFAKLDPYERRDANLNSYGLTVQDWA